MDQFTPLAPTSAPTLKGFKRLEGGMGERGKGNVSHMEESGVLGEYTFRGPLRLQPQLVVVELGN